jgi:hypothetical protein
MVVLLLLPERQDKMHKVSFFPIENADCCRIVLSSGARLLFDYCHRRKPGNDKYDLADNIKQDLLKRGDLLVEVLCITHLDDDHCDGAEDFFYFEYAKKYQGEGRTKIKDLWVPAAAILETGVEDSAWVIRQEAIHRLTKQKSGVKVFSRPGSLDDWLKAKGVNPKDVEHLIVDAGTYVPGWKKGTQGVEFFVHSPFAMRQGDGAPQSRNNNAIFVQATFQEGTRDTRLILSADVDSDVIADIVKVSKYHHNEARLGWDINNVPHHSSYKSLNAGGERCGTITPIDEVDWLYQQGGTGGYLVSTSKTIPSDCAEKMPPHKNAADYYKEQASKIAGEYVVTADFPTKAKPAEMVFEITSQGAKLIKQSGSVGSGGAISTPASRAGFWDLDRIALFGMLTLVGLIIGRPFGSRG